MNTPKQLLKDFWPSLLTLGVILYATLTPNPAGAEQFMLFPGADKVIHAIMMGGLTGAIAFDCRRTKRIANLTILNTLPIAIGVAIFSILDEFLQAYVDTGRSAELLDILGDYVGILIALFLAPPVVNAIFNKKH